MGPASIPVVENGPEFLISRTADRRNQIAFAVASIVIYLAAPVFYIGMVQAALCSRLGSNASVANLPLAVVALTGMAPLFAAWVVPYRRERSVVVWCALTSAASLAITGGVLVGSGSNAVRIIAVIGCSLVVSLASSVQQVYLYQCLSRGTTVAGRARTIRITFTLGPLAAVAGSLMTQAILDGRWLQLAFPYNFATIYFLSFPCALVVAMAGTQQRVIDVAEQPKRALGSYLGETFRAVCRSRTLAMLCITYGLSSAALVCAPNLTLYLDAAMGKAPELLVGYVMAIRFTGKSVGGFVLGWAALKWNGKTALVLIQATVLFGCVWALLAHGGAYLACFALLGIGELAGAYFPNYCLSVSPVEFGARNLALLAIFASVSGSSAALYGALADIWGYPISIAAAGVLAAIALMLARRLPSDSTAVPARMA